MNRAHRVGLRLACVIVAAILLCSRVNGMQVKSPASPPAPQTVAPAQEEPAQQDEDQNPFVPEPAGPLPAGMTGSDVNDPRANLTPGLYDAGETSMGLKHVLLFKKPDAFQLGAVDPDDPKVGKTIGQLGIPVPLSKIPKPLQLVIAQLAFSNSDLAFQGNHLFEGNFYGVNIFDVSNPANATLLTSMVCPGGQGDVSVYENLLFMSVEMPNGRLDCGTQGFPPEPPQPPPAAGQEKDQKKEFRPPSAQKDRFRGVRIFDI
jgi:hypothetical protein